MKKEIRDKKEEETSISGKVTIADQEAARRKIAPPKIRNNGCMVARTLAGDLYFNEYGDPVGIAR